MDKDNLLVRKVSPSSFLLLSSCILVAWIICAWILVPTIIESAYHGKAHPALNSLIEGQHVHSLDHYLEVWYRVGLSIPFLIFYQACLGILVLISPAKFFRKYVGNATPGALGAIRMLTCGFLLVSTLWEDLGSSALLPPELRRPLGVMRLFYALPIGFETFVGSEIALKIFQWTTTLILFLGTIGWRTRIVIPLGAFCYLILGGNLRQYAWFYHTGILPLYFMALLSFTPCGHGWSIDRLIRVYQGQSAPKAASSIYGWSRYTCWVIIALTYVMAGLSKLGNGGPSWWDATSIRYYLYRGTLSPTDFDWGLSLILAESPDILFELLGISAVIGELSFGLVVFSRVSRLLLPGVMVLMHTGVFLLQNIPFFDSILLQLVFLDFTKVRKAIGHYLALRRGWIELLYDGSCPLCRRTVRLLASLDLLERLKFVEFRGLDLEAYNRSHALKLTRSNLEGQMHVISQGRVFVGFYSYQRIALELPLFWPVAPLLFLPGLPLLGAVFYDYVARNRFNHVTCDSQCPIDSSNDITGTLPIRAKHSSLPRIHYPLAVSGLSTILLLFWFFRIEFYPFTSWQMMSTTNKSGVTEYVAAFATYESGETARAPFAEAIGALADGRYRYAIWLAFSLSPERVDICKKFIEAVASSYNADVSPGQRILRFEIQSREWNFQSNPLGHHGELVDRFIFETNPLQLQDQKT